MPAHEAAVGTPCWIELFTSDTDRARSFYGEVLGWECEEANEEFGGYANFTLDGGRIAGLMGSQDPDHPADFWNTYLRSNDIEATAAKVAASGTATYLPPHPVGELGHFAMFADAGGAGIGAWQPGTHRGFGQMGETGAPSWFELHADRFDDTVAWYQQVFGWAPEPMGDEPGFRYSCQPVPGGGDDDWAAAIMDTEGQRPEGVPPYWAIYFQVADTDGAVARIVELGGSLLDGPQDSPFGRIADVTDPMGAPFKIGSAPN